ncbi:MAG: hypothetical protein H0T51_06655 [Pirellulales bacterium]|nr:hypothetical protein [Pirellulales bacterium]
MAAEALNGKPGGELLADLGAIFEDFRRGQSPGERFKPITAKELAEGDYRVNWVVDYLLVEGATLHPGRRQENAEDHAALRLTVVHCDRHQENCIVVFFHGWR